MPASQQLPNLITALRLAGSPVMAWLLWHGRFRTAFWVVILAGVSDWLDGYAARKLQAKGSTGVILDPLADKAMLLTLFIVLSAIGALPLWLLLLVVSRDLIIVTGAILLRVRRGFQRFLPTMAGKISTFFQIILVLLVLLQKSYPTQAVWALQQLALGLTALFTSVSGLDYIRKGCQMAGWLPGGFPTSGPKVH